MATALDAKRARLRSATIGVVLLVLVGFFLYIALNAQKGLPFIPHGYYKIAVADAGDLTPGNDVRVSGNRAGRVNGIALENGTAVVEMQFDDAGLKLYRNGSSRVTSRSGLGQKYLDVALGTPDAGELQPGEVLVATPGQLPTQLLDLARVFDEPTQKATQTTLREFGGGLAGRGPDIHDLFAAAPEILPDLGTVSASLSRDDGRDLTSMLRSLDNLASRFDGTAQKINDLEGQLATTLAAFNADGGDPLGRTLDVAPKALADTRAALADFDKPLRDTGTAFGDLEPAAAQLGDSMPNLRGFLRESPGPLYKFPDVSNTATPALSSLTEVMDDARPFAAKFHELVDNADDPLGRLAPYAPEISKWFSYATSALGDGDPAGHWLRFTIFARPESLSGGGGFEDPTTQGNPYPGPGNAPDGRPTPDGFVPNGVPQNPISEAVEDNGGPKAPEFPEGPPAPTAPQAPEGALPGGGE